MKGTHFSCYIWINSWEALEIKQKAFPMPNAHGSTHGQAHVPTQSIHIIIWKCYFIAASKCVCVCVCERIKQSPCEPSSLPNHTFNHRIERIYIHAISVESLFHIIWVPCSDLDRVLQNHIYVLAYVGYYGHMKCTAILAACACGGGWMFTWIQQHSQFNTSYIIHIH